MRERTKGDCRMRLSMKRLAAATAIVLAAVATTASAGQQQVLSDGPVYKVVGKIGKEGAGNGQFSTNVTGLDTDSEGNVYVSVNSTSAKTGAVVRMTN